MSPAGDRAVADIVLPILVVSALLVLVRGWFMGDANLWLLAPDLTLLVGASLVLTLGFWSSRGGLALVSGATVAIAGAVCLFQLMGPTTNGLPNTGIAFGILDADPFAIVLKLVFLAVTGLVVVASPNAVGGKHQGEYYSLLLFATMGMMMVAGSRDLITLFLGFEMSSFASYALAAYNRRDIASVEGGMKYFITGSIGSALILFGTSMLFVLTTTGTNPAVVAGDVTFANLGRMFSGQPGLDPFLPMVILAVVFLIGGFGYKVAAFPFHMWAPDAYDGSPSAVSAFLAAGSKKMGFAALFKVFLIALIAVRADWDLLIGLVAVATMTVGNLLALSQTNIKRMLAYSSIAQAGYILIALPVAAVAGDAAGQYAMAGGIFHILTHAFMKAGAFIVVAGLIAVGLSERLDDFRGLSRRAPLLAFAMAVFLVSMAGIPPLAGFASKFVLFSGAVSASLLPDGGWLIFLAIAGILNSAVSLYYYAKVVRVMYVEEPEAHQAAALPIPRGIAASVALAMIAVVLIGLWPAPFIDVSMRAAESLVAAGTPFR